MGVRWPDIFRRIARLALRLPADVIEPAMRGQDKSEPVRVVVFCDYPVQRWQAECLDVLHAAPGFEIVGFAQRKTQPPRTLPAILFGWLFRCARMRPAAMPSWTDTMPRVIWAERKDPSGTIVTEPQAEWLETLRPVLIVCLATWRVDAPMNVELCAEVWWFRHGRATAQSDALPAFAEFANGERRIALTLRAVAPGDAGFVLERGYVPAVPWSAAASLERLYGNSAALLRRALLRFRETGSVRGEPDDRDFPECHEPSLHEGLKVIWHLVANTLSWAIEKAFFETKWQIGVLDDVPSLEGDIEVAPQWMESPKDGFLADPGPVPGRTDVILVEHYIRVHGRGRIDVVEVRDKGRSLHLAGTALDTGLHLSFPQVYEVDRRRWLVAESAAHRAQLAFELSADLRAVDPSARRIIEGLSGVDPVIFRHNGRWWAFLSPGGSSGSHLLNVFYADDFLGPYRPHAANPVVIDPWGARPAAPIMTAGGSPIRFGQVFDRRYGEGIDVFRITALNVNVYGETRIARIRPRNDDACARGTHGLALLDGRAVIDGYEMILSPLAGINRVWTRLRR